MPRIIVVVLAALTLAACSAQPPEVTANEQVPADQRTEATSPSEGATGGAGGGGGETFVAIDINYEAAPESLPAGDTEITLTNNGAAPHDVTFEELGDETVVAAGPGETATGAATLEPGELTYYCSVPGHREAGMEGTLTVE